MMLPTRDCSEFLIFSDSSSSVVDVRTKVHWSRTHLSCRGKAKLSPDRTLSSTSSLKIARIRLATLCSSSIGAAIIMFFNFLICSKIGRASCRVSVYFYVFYVVVKRAMHDYNVLVVAYLK